MVGLLRKRASIWPARSGSKRQRCSRAQRLALARTGGPTDARAAAGPNSRARPAARSSIDGVCRRSAPAKWRPASDANRCIQGSGPLLWLLSFGPANESDSPAGARPGTCRVRRSPAIARVSRDFPRIPEIPLRRTRCPASKKSNSCRSTCPLPSRAATPSRASSRRRPPSCASAATTAARATATATPSAPAAPRFSRC